MIPKLPVCFSYCINWRSILLFLDSFGDTDDDSSYYVEAPSGEGDFCPQDTPTWPTILHQGNSNLECLLFKIEYIFKCHLYLHHFIHSVSTILNQRKRC